MLNPGDIWCKYNLNNQFSCMGLVDYHVLFSREQEGEGPWARERVGDEMVDNQRGA